jgi:HK97 family phage portal protein
MKILNSIGNAFRWMIRATTSLSISDIRNPRPWLVNWVTGATSSAGVNVNHDSAMQLAVYYACLANISSDVAKLPLCVKKKLDRGYEELHDHPVYRLLYIQPNTEMTSFTWREMVQHWAMSWGNGIADIERLQDGTPHALWPIHPSRVNIIRRNNQIVYQIRSGTQYDRDMKFVERLPEQVIHLRGPGQGLWGYSVMRLATESIGLGLAAQQFGAAFFGNGTTLNGVLEHPEKLSDPAYERLRKTWSEAHQGPANAHKPAILEEGMKWTQMSIPPDEAQFLQTRQFQIEDICRWFRMPPHKVQHLLRSTFSNIESQNIEYGGDTLQPWICRWEQELKSKLFLEREADVYAKFDMNELMRADAAARASFNREMFNVGAFSPNDIREREGLNPIDGGDEHFMQVNMTTMKRIIDGTAQAKALPEPPPDGKQPKPGEEKKPEEQKDDNTTAVHRLMLVDPAERVIRRESNAVKRALVKYIQDKNALHNWVESFFDEQIDYFYRVFENSVTSIARLRKTDVGASLKRLGTVSRDYAMIRLATLAASEAYEQDESVNVCSLIMKEVFDA